MINGLIFKGVNEKILPTLKSIDVDYTECTGLSCGKFYNIGTLPSDCSQLDFSFKQIEDYEIPFGFLQFNIDENSSLTSLSGTYDNEDVKWLNKPSTFVEGKTYQIHFLNSCCTCEEYDEDGQSISTDSYLNRATVLSSTSTDTSFALGGACKASNDYSVAEGYDSIANGYASHAEGNTTKATSAMAHAEGSLTNAKAYASHAEGELAEVNSAADYSHAEGKTTYCIGRAAHAEGGYTIVNNDYEHAEGRFNYSHSAAPGFGSSANTLHSIGIGSGIFADDTYYDLLAHGELPAGAVTAHSKNAVEVMQNGDMYVLDIGGYDGQEITSATTLQEVINNMQEQINELKMMLTSLE